MTSTATTTATLVGDFSARFGARYITDHSVGSGLGLWLLLALVAPAVQGDARRRLEGVLGTDAEDAARRAARLLDDPHPAVLAAVAVWNRTRAVTAAFEGWSATLPDVVERGPMPTPDEADEWAHRHTRGLIPTFPAAIDEATEVLLASALATDVTWIEPFDSVPARVLGGTFSESIELALWASSTHPQMLADTDAAGVVAVHAADADTGLRVISVIGAPDRTPQQLHLATDQVAHLLTGDDRHVRPLDLFELELGVGHAWTLTEDEIMLPGESGPIQEVTSTLAAWTARSHHDLAGAPGVAEAATVADRFVDVPGPTTVDAHQAAVAEYSRVGFRAAAITEIRFGRSGPQDVRRVLRRTARVRFNRPYAVLAVALGPRDRVSSWTGVPVFSAWVGEVVDTIDDLPEFNRTRGASRPDDRPAS